MALHAAQFFGEHVRVATIAVDATRQRVFKDHAAAGLFDVIAAGGENFVDGVRVRHRHELLSRLVVGRVQRNRQRHLKALVREAPHRGHEAAGGQRDRPGGEVQPPLVDGEAQEFDHVFVVVQRFAAPHQHHIVHAALLRADHPVHRHDLAQHFAGGEVSDQAAQRRRAEGAAHPAAHLCGHTQRVTMAVAHQDALDEVAVREPIEQLLGIVNARAHRSFNCHRLRECDGGKFFAQRLRQVGHGGEVLAPDEPLMQLLGAEGGEALRFDKRRQFLRRQRQKLGHGLTLRIRAMKNPSAFQA